VRSGGGTSEMGDVGIKENIRQMWWTSKRIFDMSGMRGTSMKDDVKKMRETSGMHVLGRR
jgi:hypothetical protein